MSEEEMEFMRAPRGNLETWKGVVRLLAFSTAGVVVLLLLMAGFLLG